MTTQPIKIRVLCIDGGGIRGIVPGTILQWIEEQIQQRTGNNNARIADYFDFVAGTSTGGILGCTLLTPDANKRPLYTAQQAVGLYLQRGGEIFSTTWWQTLLSVFGLRDEKYSAANLENILQEYLKDIRMSQLLKPCLFTSYNVTKGNTAFFDQKDEKGDYNDYLVRHIARATSAAPTYFEAEPLTGKNDSTYAMIDGGVFANNPTACALADVLKLHPDVNLNEIFILSLGTGVSPKQLHQHPFSQIKKWGMIQWIRPLISIMMSASAETIDYQINKIFSARASSNYTRLQPSLPTSSAKIDDASPTNMQALQSDTQKYIEAQKTTMNNIVDILISQSVSK